jgi:hypothetical protein
MSDKQVTELRHELADALCLAQALPVPRTELHRMLATLLWTAFLGLDDGAAGDRAQAVTVAMHALREWRLLMDIDRPPATASAP